MKGELAFLIQTEQKWASRFDIANDGLKKAISTHRYADALSMETQKNIIGLFLLDIRRRKAAFSQPYE